MSATLAIKLRTYTNGTCRISSPPPGRWKENAPNSATTLSPVMVFARTRCLFSLASVMLRVLSHLQ